MWMKVLTARLCAGLGLKTFAIWRGISLAEVSVFVADVGHALAFNIPWDSPSN
jgi:hypothetical protein